MASTRKPIADGNSNDRHPEVVKAEEQELPHFVTTIKSAEAQVGEHIIQALRHRDTVAVLTTVVVGPDGRQQVVSAALDPDLMSQVQQLLRQAQQRREPEDPCVGFHCLVKAKQDDPSSPPPS